MTRTIFNILAAAALIVSAAPCAAQDMTVRTVRVSYADLDLSGPAGAKALQRRLDHAVAAVCGDADTGDLASYTAMANCRRQARSGADAGFKIAMSGQPGPREFVLASR